MSAVEEYPPSGPVTAGPWPGVPGDEGSLAEEDGFFAGMPSGERLRKWTAAAEDAIEVQDSSALRNRKTLGELQAEWEVEAERRAGLLEATRLRNAGEIEVAKLRNQGDVEVARIQTEAKVEAERREVQTETNLAEARQAEQLDAAKARERLRQVDDPVSALARQFRIRKKVMLTCLAPAVGAMGAGAVHVQVAWTSWRNIGPDNPLYWVVLVFDLLLTLPVVGIMLYLGSQLRETPALSGVKDAFRRRGAVTDKVRLVRVAALLLLISIAMQVTPHVAVSDWGQAVLWMVVPLIIVVTLDMLPVYQRGFNERFAHLKAEAEKSVARGHLTADEVRTLTVVGRVVKQVSESTVDGKTEMSNNKVYQALRDAQGGRAGRPDGVKAAEGLQVIHKAMNS